MPKLITRDMSILHVQITDVLAMITDQERERRGEDKTRESGPSDACGSPFRLIQLI